MKHVTTFMIKKRILLMLIVCATIMIVIVGRLAFVQFFLGQELTSKATDSWLRDIKFRAERGNILDRNGKLLTENISSPSVFLVPRQMKDKEYVARQLSDILNISLEKAMEYVSKNASNVEIHPAGRKITDEQEDKIRRLHMDGVYLAKDSKRYYPHKDYLSHVLGFTGIDNQGLMGLELQHDQKLKGTDGSLSYYSDAKGRRVKDTPYVYDTPKDGNHLKTTIDLRIQTIMARELTNAEEKYSPDAAIAMAVDRKSAV